ncbi:hypothetical protein PENSPDRAFT_655640 [Peniophora sp. CONT]|nr:hypothetical protein PENSPDRAFT_655640 [Peniophora sp. CONT]
MSSLPQPPLMAPRGAGAVCRWPHAPVRVNPPHRISPFQSVVLTSDGVQKRAHDVRTHF